MGEEEKEILSQLRGGSAQRQKVIASLIAKTKLQDDIAAYISNRGGDDDDVKMIFHDCILAFVKRVFKDHNFELTSTVDAYIFGIAKILWHGHLKSNKKHLETPTLDIPEGDYGMWRSYVSAAETKDTLHHILNQISPKCREVLLFWAGGYSMDEIANRCGYQSEGMARKKKCECLKSLIKWLKEHPQYINELKQ